MNNKRNINKEKYQQIRVFVRVRPNNAEQNNKHLHVVEVPNDKEIILHERSHEECTKKFKFNHIFGPSSKQIDVYNVVANPLLDEVLAGYNCTVIAYGQTGTGKTFTMEGINSDPDLDWQSDSSAGIIPRFVSHLFDKLHLLKIQEYTIRVSFLELHNEDLFDLLAPTDDTPKIRLFEDPSRKGAVIIHGATELIIRNKNEVLRILEKGAKKRQIIATFMNTQSSRSHTMFSIAVHMKENITSNKQVLKTGKLNLVDLAGSENIGKSGAVDMRAREAGVINQSLLTLGRVITAIVKGASHIPYRESKLTRILQESLGGRTKTSIIATISANIINMEETLSTLNYIYRARNITNCPEINKKYSKIEYLKQYVDEIVRLKRDLLASHEKKGIYIKNENYGEKQTLISQQAKEIEDKINLIKALEKAIEDKQNIYNELALQNMAQTKELHESKVKLDRTVDALNSTRNVIESINQEQAQQNYLIGKYMRTEQSLLNQAQILLSVADTATADLYKLHDKIERKNQTERALEHLEVEFKNNVSECLHQIKKDILIYVENLQHFASSMKNSFGTEFFTKYQGIDTAVAQISTDLFNQHLNDTNNLKECVDKSCSNYQKWTQKTMENAISITRSESQFLNAISAKMAENIENMIENEVAKNLRILRGVISERLQQASNMVKEIIDSAYTNQLETYNNINKDVDNIVKDIEMLRKRQIFSHKQHLLTKMMGDVLTQFNDLNESQKEYYSTVNSECDYIANICNEVHSHMATGYNTNIAMCNNLKEQVGRNIEKIKNDVVYETKLNENLLIRKAAGEALINKLKSNINESCNILEQYRNHVESKIKKIQSNINTDRNEAMLLIQDARKSFFDVSRAHVEFMQDKKIKICTDLEGAYGNFDVQIKKSCTCGENIAQKLQKKATEVNEFFDKDIQRDVPTGSTPTRKEFSYPREFKTTSPHERILQRFREIRRTVKSIENDITGVNSEMIMKPMVNSTTLSDMSYYLQSLIIQCLRPF